MAACISSSSELWRWRDNSLFCRSVVRLLDFSIWLFRTPLNCQYLSKHAAMAALCQISDQEIDWSGHAVHFLESLSLSFSPETKWLRTVKYLIASDEYFSPTSHIKVNKTLNQAVIHLNGFLKPEELPEMWKQYFNPHVKYMSFTRSHLIYDKGNLFKNSIWILLFKWLIIQNHSEILIICFYRLHGRDAGRQIWRANYRHACIGVIFSVWLCCALCSHITWQKYEPLPSRSHSLRS